MATLLSIDLPKVVLVVDVDDSVALGKKLDSWSSRSIALSEMASSSAKATADSDAAAAVVRRLRDSQAARNSSSRRSSSAGGGAQGLVLHDSSRVRQVSAIREAHAPARRNTSSSRSTLSAEGPRG